MAQPGVDKLEHVIVVMLENRSFDHLLGFLDHPDPAFEGVNESMTNPRDPSRPELGSVAVTMRRWLRLRVDPDHAHEAVITQLGLGRGATPTNDGFVFSYEQKAVGRGAGGRKARRAAVVLNSVAGTFLLLAAVGAVWARRPRLAGIAGVMGIVVVGVRIRAVPAPDHFPGDGPRIMRCCSPASIPALATLAKSFAVCTRWFCSVPGETWPNRQFLHAATSAGTVNIVAKPYGDQTIFELIEKAGNDWRIYFDGPAQVVCYPALWVDSDRHANWHLIEDLFRDIDRGDLPVYSFVEPNHGYVGRPYSQHPGNNKRIPTDFRRADRFIAGVYEALRKNPALFEKTLLVVTWDEHGGTFDHVTPEPTVAPDQRGAGTFDFRRYGPRVPAIIVSQWIPPATVDATVYDHSSVPATLRSRFAPSESPLTGRDAEAEDFLHLLSRDSPRTGEELPSLSRRAWRPKATLSWLYQVISWVRAQIRGDEPFHVSLSRLSAQVDEALTIAGEKRRVSTAPTGAAVSVDAHAAAQPLPPPPAAPRRTSARAARKLARAGAEARAVRTSS